MSDIFLSYASEDRPRIEPLVAALESAGWSVWWDRNLVAGPSFDEKIEEALSAAQCVVVVWTENSVASRWCRAEANEGLERKILVPVCLDDVRPPLVFRSSQTASLVGWPERRSGLDDLLKGVQACLGVAAPGGRDLPGPLDRSIAVAPFTSSGGSDAGDRASQLQTELLGLLSNYQELRAIDADAASAADATYIVKGNISITGSTVRVRVGLVRSFDQRAVWSQTFEVPAAEVVQAPTDLPSTIARHVRLQLVLDHQVEAVRRTCRIPEAVEYYKAALTENYRISQGGGRDADICLSNSRRAIELDPSIVDAYWLLAVAYYERWSSGQMSWREASEMAHDAIDRGQVLEPNNALLHHARGLIQFSVDLNYDAARASLEAAIAQDSLHPNARWFHFELGLVAQYRGDLSAARQHYGRAIRIYDADMMIYGNYANVLVWSGAYRKALEVADTGLRLGARGVYAFMFAESQMRAHFALGHVSEANEVLDGVLRRLEQRAWTSGGVASLLFQAGRYDEGLQVIEALKRSPTPSAVEMAFALRHVDYDATFDLLHECIDSHAPSVISGLRSDPVWKNLSQDPRWAEVIAHLEREEAGTGES